MKASSITYTQSKGVQCVYVSADTISVEDGEMIGSAPVNTNYGGGTLYRFVGWFTEKDCINQWNLYKDEVRCDLTLYPKYEKI